MSNRVDKMVLLTELNKRLKEENILLEAIVVGGYVLEYNKVRGTEDIDGFYRRTSRLDELVKIIGDTYGYKTKNGEPWLNDSVSTCNPEPPNEVCFLMQEFSHIKLYAPNAKYLIGMKLYSFRDRDKADIAWYLRYHNFTSPSQLRKDLRGMGFTELDFGNLVEAYQLAFGDDWLIEHISEFREDGC